ncbi:glycosyltransferase family 2 protein [Tuberibacillus sp. Marseille-P3662]|uniref:glycosyltransferase family 2 protein n=1 Tax=Tuberibacillus sp. Marseille-P3662 TaxID=1965358 RepID=UPI000A1C9F10|nr:glycosyltransferase family 2 protein [Tuberibacillus sp. Marseille-P3662]
MKDIHVFFLDYSSQSALEQALKSLELISDRIKGITVFEDGHSFKHHWQAFEHELDYRKIDRGDLGGTLNQYVQMLTSEYVLFFYDQDYLTPNIKNQPLILNRSQSVMTYSYNFHHTVIQRPFVAKTSVLKQNPFLSMHQLPFKEAVLPSWLLHFNPSEVTILKEICIKQAKKKMNANAFHKQQFLEKYSAKPLSSLPRIPSISVMISNFNMVQYVETAIASCVWQTDPVDQVLVIDDGSTDGSDSRIEKWTQDPKIKLLRKDNGGKARALNELLPYVQTEFVLELDADDWLDPDAFSIIKQYLSVLPDDSQVLYGNLKTWKQLSSGDVRFKSINKGRPVNDKKALLSYRFPLGPRIYRTSALKANGGFPIVEFQDGRLYEDVSILNDLIKRGPLYYQDFTVYNVREHDSSITKRNHSKWNDFIKYMN